MGYFKQHVPESRIEHYRIRYVNIYYYLEDDTIEVIEPLVKVRTRSCFYLISPSQKIKCSRSDMRIASEKGKKSNFILSSLYRIAVYFLRVDY